MQRQIISGRWAKYLWPSQNIRTLRGGSFVFLMHQSFRCLYLIAHRMISHLRLECLHSFLQSSTEIMIKYNHEAGDKCSILCLLVSFRCTVACCTIVRRCDGKRLEVLSLCNVQDILLTLLTYQVVRGVKHTLGRVGTYSIFYM